MNKLALAWKVAFAAILLYVISYVSLSLLGAYLPFHSVKLKAPIQFAFSNTEVWRPRYVLLKIESDLEGTTHTSANLLGWIYLPLEILDRRFWHPTRPQSPQSWAI